MARAATFSPCCRPAQCSRGTRRGPLLPPLRGPLRTQRPSCRPAGRLMQQADFAFANDIRAAVELRTPRTSRMLMAATLSLIVTGLVWAHFAVLDEVKRGNGRVI